jgi:hypothetical protein
VEPYELVVRAIHEIVQAVPTRHYKRLHE